MDLISISRTLGMLALMLAGLAGLMALVALMQGEVALAGGFGLSFALGLFFGASLVIVALGRPGRGGVREAVAFAILAWTLAPAIAAPPFAAAGDGNALRAYADALSAATTTGLRPFFLDHANDGVLIAWWNLLQWAGGGATVMTALIVLASVNVSGAGLHRSPLFTLEQDRLFERFAPVGRAVFSVYALGTLVAFILIWIAGEPMFEAAAIAMASVATGGVLQPEGVATMRDASPAVAVAASCALIFGAFNFALHYDVFRGRGPKVYARDPEARALVIFFVLAIVVVIFATGAQTLGEAARAGAAGVALATTAGWGYGVFDGASHLAPVIMALVIVGGSPASSAGGVKLMRIVLLARQAVGELNRLSMPSSVYDLKFRGKTLPSDAVMSMLAYVVAYAIGLGGLIVAFGAFGAQLPVAAAAAAASISNAGPALRLAADPDEAARLLASSGGTATFCVGMILGRLEVFAALAVLSPGFWRR